MNRREFTRGLASIGLTPAVSLPSLGAGSAGTALAAASAEKMYFVGWYTARLNKTCSPDLLVRELGVQPNVANQIFSKLVKTQTVSTPNALGVSKTLEPLAESFSRITGGYAKQIISEAPCRLPREDLIDVDLEPCDDQEDCEDALATNGEDTGADECDGAFERVELEDVSEGLLK